MTRIAERFRLKPGKKEEYKKRHDEIWPEMIQLMRKAGIKNYSIWNAGDDLFGYFEVDDYSHLVNVMENSDIKKKWDEYMADIIEVDIDPETKLSKNMELMFLFE